MIHVIRRKEMTKLKYVLPPSKISAVVLVGALQAVGDSLGGAFTKISTEVSNATGA
jgi:hypothetical protein